MEPSEKKEKIRGTTATSQQFGRNPSVDEEADIKNEGEISGSNGCRRGCGLLDVEMEGKITCLFFWSDRVEKISIAYSEREQHVQDRTRSGKTACRGKGLEKSGESVKGKNALRAVAPTGWSQKTYQSTSPADQKEGPPALGRLVNHGNKQSRHEDSASPCARKTPTKKGIKNPSPRPAVQVVAATQRGKWGKKIVPLGRGKILFFAPPPRKESHPLRKGTSN